MSLAKLTTLPGGRAQFQASSAGSVLDLSSLPSLIGNDSTGFASAISASNGGTILSPKLALISLANLDLTPAVVRSMSRR